jgi:hypothetical protein
MEGSIVSDTARIANVRYGLEFRYRDQLVIAIPLRALFNMTILSSDSTKSSGLPTIVNSSLATSICKITISTLRTRAGIQ